MNAEEWLLAQQIIALCNTDLDGVALGPTAPLWSLPIGQREKALADCLSWLVGWDEEMPRPEWFEAEVEQRVQLLADDSESLTRHYGRITGPDVRPLTMAEANLVDEMRAAYQALGSDLIENDMGPGAPIWHLGEDERLRRLKLRVKELRAAMKKAQGAKKA